MLLVRLLLSLMFLSVFLGAVYYALYQVVSKARKVADRDLRNQSTESLIAELRKSNNGKSLYLSLDPETRNILVTRLTMVEGHSSLGSAMLGFHDYLYPSKFQRPFEDDNEDDYDGSEPLGRVIVDVIRNRW